MVTHYEVLGVSETATAAEIRRAYVAAARRNHPDLVSLTQPAARAAAERKMATINLAWSVLGDAAKRQRYDLELRRGRNDGRDDGRDDGRRSAWNQRAGPVAGGPSPDFVPFDPDDDPEPFDPELLDDTPFPGSRAVPRWMQVLPVALLSVSLGSFAVYFVTSMKFVLGLAGVTFGLATVSFLLAPMFAIAHSSRPRS